MKIVFCLPRRPKSLNAKLSQGYRVALHAAALRAAGGGLLEGPLYSRVIWFQRYVSTEGDVDNILKPIHDALKGAAFRDDHTIIRTASFRIDITREYEIESAAENSDDEFELLAQLDRSENKDVLYIEVGQQSDSRVRLGSFS